jgi:dCTP deaminase
MAILTKKDIVERIKSESITFTPPIDLFQLNPHAVDLRLGFTFLIPKMWHMTAKGREGLNIDHFDENRPDYFDILELEKGQYFDLLPGEYISVSTLESITMPNDLMATLYPRSSTNRKGLSVDLTGIIDSGYKGQLTIPVRNNTRSQIIRLYPGERFCQVTFEDLTHTVEVKKSKYHNKDIIEGFIQDKDEEMRLIQQGEIKELKEKFSI